MFIDWMNTIERVFKYKDIPDNKKVKLVALNSVNMLLFGGTMSCLKELERGRERLSLGGK